MIRDKYACWIPVAHGLLSHEFGELIAEFLLVIKKWVTWNLRYVLSDDSAAEIKAFRLAFLGLAAGETEVRTPEITLFLIKPLTAFRLVTCSAGSIASVRFNESLALRQTPSHVLHLWLLSVIAVRS
jgi:hypothetical protein